MSVEIETEPIPSVKDLASSEPSTRRACLKTITTHLEERSPSNPLTPTQCLQLWRGLYVALYMHDSKNAVSVQNLASELSKTVQTMASKDDELRTGQSDPSWLQSWSLAFWETICREWSSIDQWRMNKILMLVRFVVRETFNVSLSRAASELDDDTSTSPSSLSITSQQTKIFETWPLSPRERQVPDGLRLHVLDVWVDELSGQVDAVQKGLDEGSGETSAEKKSTLIDGAAKRFMVPVEKISKEAISRGVKMRAKDALKRWQESFSS
ncbi:uncharacterized protein PV06_09742 [Exophiala oligosperma]|uniref:Ribosomal RNA-processing protein 1 n=2 Tax=Chaetothyriales TaxID=34395 RepID=A0A0D2ABN5_9EURO|nr:uncharacterized protein PV06_09742 [Exophiala oligosperma]KAJ9632828.1 hypothetical protein H2204_007558 [Knufia peltigerae]KIW37746.1 hypothetical protein PV06_09742 [Exophiala oligosperma]